MGLEVVSHAGICRKGCRKMDNNSLFSFMDILIAGCGIYLMYCWYLLQFKGEVKKGVLLPDKSTAHCKDLDGYKKAIGGKLFVFALSALAAGGLGLFSDYVRPVNTYVYLGLTAVFLVVLIWFTRSAKKAEKEFFC